jgi:coenzyme PQQ precursor peptide PqqA
LIGCAGLNILALAGAKPVKLEEQIMPWKTPKVVEVSLALEINSYASAEIG